MLLASITDTTHDIQKNTKIPNFIHHQYRKQKSVERLWKCCFSDHNSNDIYAGAHALFYIWLGHLFCVFVRP